MRIGEHNAIRSLGMKASLTASRLSGFPPVWVRGLCSPEVLAAKNKHGAAATPGVFKGPGGPYLLSMSSSGYLSTTLMMSSTTSPTHRICFCSMRPFLLALLQGFLLRWLLSCRITFPLPRGCLAPPPRPELLLQGASCSAERCSGVQRKQAGPCFPRPPTQAGLGAQSPRSWSTASP